MFHQFRVEIMLVTRLSSVTLNMIFIFYHPASSIVTASLLLEMVLWFTCHNFLMKFTRMKKKEWPIGKKDSLSLTEHIWVCWVNIRVLILLLHFSLALFSWHTFIYKKNASNVTPFRLLFQYLTFIKQSTGIKKHKRASNNWEPLKKELVQLTRPKLQGREFEWLIYWETLVFLKKNSVL